MNLARKLTAEELSIFETKFKAYVKSNVPLLDRIMQYIVKRKGKQLRPMFVLLSAKLCGGVNDATYRAASLVELLHTASLVHDDVVDESYERRGFFSTYALWKSKVSVLVGDYLLSKGLLLSLDGGDYRILHILSEAVRKMSEGELLQIEKARGLNLNEAIYFEIIKTKTASLLASACSAGAYSASQNEALAEKFRQFGEYAGVAFQIKDDLFDYGSDAIGKPTGNDIKEKKLTLPLIYTLNKVAPSKRRELIYIIKNQNKNKEKVNYVIEQVKLAGGISYGLEKMTAYKNKAIQLLHEFPPSENRDALEELVNYTTDRKL
ncbi:MAG: polyprenyl synthetase family protein [Terrimonas sp.]|uniref:polyprenyl synthetase family protein n=1 Tax=Terrimonas sp. TaxID=1914338 RepID=UPI00092B94A4|nr:polyprenyl synthetase family protein [Terrimonas sp.]MBN8790368.1 polyprenyl synthetase family protein [Terrimonas sp.]OJY99160.1 MAG: polyprenyl synthetase [Sphingobacteriales bacterium 40-81]PVD53216.1 polyprenyl synthetase [Terrimonas sp.]